MDEAVKEQAIDLLLEARDDIARPGGWCQGTFHDPLTGAHCMVGAINDAYFREQRDGRVYVAMTWAAMEATGAFTVPWFNDMPGRTQRECVNALDDAASYLKGLST